MSSAFQSVIRMSRNRVASKQSLAKRIRFLIGLSRIFNRFLLLSPIFGLVCALVLIFTQNLWFGLPFFLLLFIAHFAREPVIVYLEGIQPVEDWDRRIMILAQHKRMGSISPSVEQACQNIARAGRVPTKSEADALLSYQMRFLCD